MKIDYYAALLLALLMSGCSKRAGTSGANLPPSPPTFSSFDQSSGTNAPIPAHMIRFVNADLDQVLALYGELSGRSIIHSPNVPAAKITFDNTTPLTRIEALQALDNVFAAQNLVMVYLGTKYVKVVPAAAAASEPGLVVEVPPDQLPDSSSFVIYVVRLKNVAPMQAVSAIQPFAKLPNSIVAVNSGGNNPAAARGAVPTLSDKFLGPKEVHLLILRDYSANVRRMLQVLEKMENP